MAHALSSQGFDFTANQKIALSSSQAGICFREANNGRVFVSQTDREEQSSRTSIAYVDELFALFQSAKLFGADLDLDQLKAALGEAVKLKSSGLFPEYVKPQIAVDECGEFMFTYKNAAGYVDIGVCGEGEISYHARNDNEPEKTAYGDVEWDGVSVPTELIASATTIFQG
ncbi:hypothetical protein [Ruegeria arenilitoris]|uniref:hypothetical protein n=1 Tax=Ruegeria arenilitoris TaxID=1173585 RepID=UPI00147DE892|nr:hypothetical protein [Ruegeria arenilitoris]